ncbi:HNH endonuclease signature motif containing protein [Gordonia paraffinivorans]|uniref:HNH endonuclease signature motif containing protein n=2 Tax=Gordonia paraffinivorans TaxID=175628 RepID=UPI001445DF9C|nr:HNH endonuclease signature motif containing protein [Gordonia paraffinivorans]
MTETTSVDAPCDAVAIVDEIHRLCAALQRAELSTLTDAQVEYVAAETERARNRLAFAGDQQVVEVAARDLPRKTGRRNILAYMHDVLRMPRPGRRRAEAKAIATFTDLTGQPLEPELPTLAAAFADGRVGPDHVHAVMDVLDQIPAAVAHDVTAAAERTMAEYATWMTPPEIERAGARLLAHLDPDGVLTDLEDRRRRRKLWINRQRADGTSKLTATLTPELRARLATFLDVWARPGMNNPDDPDSLTGSIQDADPERLEAAAQRDLRTPAQIQHDALNALLQAVFDDGLLGKTHRGLPIQLIVKADLADLQRAAGLAATADGTLIDIEGLISMAGRVEPWLAIFVDATAAPLYLGRGKRLASMEQRLASFARPGGDSCSAPGCDVPATRVEMHHAHTDWGDGGGTDIDNLAPACTRHHHMIGNRPGDYTTRMIGSGPDAGRCTWQLNTAPGTPPRRPRINRKPDIGHRFRHILTETRNNIHPTPDKPDQRRAPDQHGQPEPGSPDDPPHPPRFHYTDLQHATPAELALYAALLDHAYPN